MIAPWVEKFIAECSAFPAGANDDQVDAWSQGAKRLLEVRAKRPPVVFGGYGGGGRFGPHGWMAH